MWIRDFHIMRSRVVRFALFPRRITLKSNPAIYHWLWYSFGLHTPNKSAVTTEIQWLEKLLNFIGGGSR